MKKPFIYICALLRTGSTLLQELLTEKPNSYIIHEPLFGYGTFQNRDLTASVLRDWGLDPALIMDEESVGQILKNVATVAQQVGIKEIRNNGWENYIGIYPNTKYILLGRNPKDIYLSCHYQLKRSDHWTPRTIPFNPAGLYGEVSLDMQAQFDIAKSQDYLKVRYEDLCCLPGVFEEIKKFVKSPIEDKGKVGEFHKLLKRGNYEREIHKDRMTTNTVNRNKFEQDKDVLSDAETFYTLMSEYNEFWGY